MKVKNLVFLPLVFISCALVEASGRTEIWGARPVALGGAFVGDAEGPDAPFWNPAGIAHSNRRGLSFTYGDAKEFSGEKVQSAWAFSFVEATPKSRPFGVFFINNSTAGVSQDQTVGLSLAGLLMERESGFKLFSGLNLKYLSQTIQTTPENDKTAFGLDLGMLAVAGPRFSVGIAARDVNRPKDMPNSNKKREPTFVLGNRLGLTSGTAFLFDVVHVRRDKHTDFRFGLEYWLLKEWLAVRLGTGRSAWSAGAGFKAGPQSQFSLDYAFQDPHDDNHRHNQHVVSLSVRWGGPKVEEGAPEASSLTETEDFDASGPRMESRAEMRMIKKVRNLKRRHEFSIGAEDVLQVDVKDHPELETIAKVDSWGFAKFPYIGDLRVEGNTPTQLTKRLEDLYQGFVEEPRVEVTISEYNSRSIYILGQVQKPGRYPIGGRQITVRDAIVMANLPTDRAAGWRTFVVRQTPNGPTYRRVNIVRIMNRGVLDNNIVLEADDIVFVPMGVLDVIVTAIGRLVSPLFGIVTSAVSGGSSN